VEVLTVIARSEATKKQSIARRNGWMDCFASLAMTERMHQHASVNWNSRPHHDTREVAPSSRKIFFIIFVDGMFTTFVARLFTNTSHAFDGIRAISCV